MQVGNWWGNKKSRRISSRISENNDVVGLIKKIKSYEIVIGASFVWNIGKRMVRESKKNIKNERRGNVWVGIWSWK